MKLSNEILGAQYVARTIAHMTPAEKADPLSRSFFITVPLREGADVNKLVEVVNVKVRKYFCFIQEKPLRLDNPKPCVGIISCGDYQGTRGIEAGNNALWAKGPHIHALLIVPDWLLAEHRNLAGALAAHLASIEEIPKTAPNGQKLFVQRVQDRGKSLNHIAGYTTKAALKVPKLAQHVESRVFPYDIWKHSDAVDFDDYDRRVNDLAADLVQKVEGLPYPADVGQARAKRERWIRNQLKKRR